MGIAFTFRRGDKIGPLLLEQRVGAGPHTTVYRASDPDGQRVAVKLPVHNDPNLLRLLEKAADPWGRIVHPNVVQLHRLLTVHEEPVIACDYVPGPNLRRWVRAARPQVSTALPVFRQILRGVGEVHALGAIHGNLSATNVLMQKTRSGPPRARITDVGLNDTAHLIKVARRELRGGNFEYLAPEQRMHPGHMSQASDVWSLGCLAYELFTGLKAFPRRGYSPPAHTIIMQDLHTVGLKPGYVELFERILDPEPSERPTCRAIERTLFGSTDIPLPIRPALDADTFTPEDASTTP